MSESNITVKYTSFFEQFKLYDYLPDADWNKLFDFPVVITSGIEACSMRQSGLALQTTTAGAKYWENGELNRQSLFILTASHRPFIGEKDLAASLAIRSLLGNLS